LQELVQQSTSARMAEQPEEAKRLSLVSKKLRMQAEAV
jgi:hypothetical protein